MPSRGVALCAVLAWWVKLAIAADPPLPPAELKQLEPFVGTWKVAEFVSRKAEWTPQEVRESGDVATTRWIMNGWFLEDRKVKGKAEHLGIWHYDPGEKAFHYTMFQFGSRTDLSIRWNDQTATFEGTATLPGGITMRSTIRFANRDTKEWQLKAVDGAGRIYMDIASRETRVMP